VFVRPKYLSLEALSPLYTCLGFFCLFFIFFCFFVRSLVCLFRTRRYTFCSLYTYFLLFFNARVASETFSRPLGGCSYSAFYRAGVYDFSLFGHVYLLSSQKKEKQFVSLSSLYARAFTHIADRQTQTRYYCARITLANLFLL